MRSPNNRILAVIRDPAQVRPTAKDTQRFAPPPANCECRNWGEAHPGTHHPICEFNLKAPPEERAPGTHEVDVSGVPDPGPSPLAPKIAPAPLPVPMPAPEDCACGGWKREPGASIKGHHPTCEFADAWKLSQRPAMVLINLKTGEMVRDARPEEISDAEAYAKRTNTGALITMLAGKAFAVVPKQEWEGKKERARALP